MEVEKPSMDTDKRDIENKKRAEKEIVVVKNLVTMENLAIVENGDKKDIEEPGRSEPIVVEDLTIEDSIAKDSDRADIKDRSRDKKEKNIRLGIPV